MFFSFSGSYCYFFLIAMTTITMIIMKSREIPPPKLPIKIGLDQIDEEIVGVTVLEVGVGVEGETIVGGITLIGGTDGVTVGVIIVGV